MEEIIVNQSLFKTFLNYVVKLINLVHTYIMSINDNSGIALSDKTLHFLVIGFTGAIILLIVHPIFKWLANRNKTIIVSWIYVFTVLVALTLCIEIGQDMTGTGNMELADIMAGLKGFFFISIIGIAIIKGYRVIKDVIRKKLVIKVERRDDENGEDNHENPSK